MLKNATKMLQGEKSNDYDYYLYQNSLLSQHVFANGIVRKDNFFDEIHKLIHAKFLLYVS